MSDQEKNPDKNPKNSGQKENPQENPPRSKLLWFVIIGGAMLVLIYVVIWPLINPNITGRKSINYTDFTRGIRDGSYHANNTFELTIGNDYITFQNIPAKKITEITDYNGNKSSNEKKPVEPEKVSLSKYQGYKVSVYALPKEEIFYLTNLLREKGVPFNGDHRPSTELQSLVPLVIIIVIIIFMIIVLQKMGGAGSAISFGRSRGKLYVQDDVKTTFENVAGIDEAVEELKEIVEFLKHPEKYQALGGRIPRGVLLVGPPGTGKTLLAKAVAGEAGVPFFGLSGSDFVEMYVGVGAARVRDLFAQAISRSPSIIFIDELDALGKARGSGQPGGHDEREHTLNALLVEMDGFASDLSVIVMGASNRPETLDPALMRPGRFDRHVLVDKPDYKGREAILKVHAASVKMDDSVNFNRIARLTPGFSGADLANLVNEAALLAARSDKKQVGMHEFEEAIERVVAGLEKSSRIISQDEKLRVAYHECGHALIASSLPHTDPVHKISIIPRGFGALGYMLQRPTEDRQLITQTELRNRIAVLLGGIAAEEVVFKETSTGPLNDLERATDFARRMVTDFGMSPKMGRVNYNVTQRNVFLGTTSSSSSFIHSEATIREIDLEVKRIIDEVMSTVVTILKERRHILEHMAKDLIEMEVMDSDHLQSILDHHRTGPQIKPGTFQDERNVEPDEFIIDQNDSGNSQTSAQ